MEVKPFVQQAIWIKRDGDQCTVTVPAQPTECPFLVVTPVVGLADEDNTLRYSGILSLTHTRTGALLVRSNYVRGFARLVEALKDLDWDFDARDHFTKPENADMASAVLKAIREWEIDEGYTGPAFFCTDDEAKREAREREPATTFLREQFDWWPKHYKSIHDRDLLRTNNDAWAAEISSSVHAWGMTYLLAALQRVDPQAADMAARRLVAEFDAGDELGEWMHQWAQEMDAGKPLTLQGIPSSDPIAGFGAGK